MGVATMQDCANARHFLYILMIVIKGHPRSDRGGGNMG
jgi:hypothetical protein